MIPTQTFLWLAIAIFGASGAITRKLTQIGAQHLTNGQNPISLCNVLLVGNLCALLVFLLIYRPHPQWLWQQQLTRKQWFGLITVATLAGALAPGLIFQALSLTSVNGVLIMGRLEPPLSLAFSVWLLRERVNAWEVAGAMAAFVGVVLTVFLAKPNPQEAYMPMMSMGLHIGVGELLAAVAALVLSTATVIGRKTLVGVPMGYFSIFRTGFGTLIFLLLAQIFYGGNHFMEVTSPFLWEWMLLYGTVIVVLGQTLWLLGLSRSSISQAALIASCTPIMGILAAFLILGEVPTRAQYIGGSVILVGLVLSQIGLQANPNQTAKYPKAKAVSMEQVMAARIGFKGI
jgi:drug/metabolite transporter (DMT)-like permease